MLALSLRRVVIASAAFIALGTAAPDWSHAADQGQIIIADEGSGAATATFGEVTGLVRTVRVGLNKSLVIDLPRDARDILVSNPVIADAVIRTPRRIYVTGVAVGSSNVIVFDRAGQQIVSLELEVERDASTLAGMLNRLLPGSAIDVEIVSDNIVLSGSVRNAGDARKAQDIAGIFANGGAQAAPGGAGSGAAAGSVSSDQLPTSAIVNMLTIEGEDQVQLKVVVAEVQRTVAKQLGIQFSGDINVGAFNASVGLNPGSGVFSTANPNSGEIGFSSGGIDISATIRALERTGMIKMLAEPTLSAISGESASFLAGGEFPIVTPASGDSPATTTFKPFGVSLDFTPVVLSEGRISLHVKTEVSSLSAQGENTLDVRRAESTLELPSGGAMVLGGLIQDNVRQTVGAVPALGKLPILGTLFRSRDFQRSETELVIIVTPYLVSPVARSALATPGEGFSPAGDAQAMFLGNINRVYGGPSGKPAAYAAERYEGFFGFIFE